MTGEIRGVVMLIEDRKSVSLRRIRSRHSRVRHVLLWSAMLLSVSLLQVSSSWASTGYVDGISDQSLPAWDNNFSGSYFAGFFQSNWINPAPHIQYARYVVQWNVMTETSSGPNPNGNYRERFESWLADAASMGLIIDVGLTSYNGVYPSSSTEYKTRLKEILNEADNTLKYPVRYLEAWNEPNAQGKESEVNAAHFTNEAYSTCEGVSPRCTIIAGNAEDNSGAKSYEEKYRTYLSPVPTIWGVHPYTAVENMEETYYTKAVEGLPNKGVGDQIWFTEVAARKCIKSTDNGEAGQARRAEWLVKTLISNQKPEHVFYWEFLLSNKKQPTCGETDDALYVPSSDPNAPDAPRPAAAFIYANAGFPWGYTGAATVSATEASATLTASIYPGAGSIHIGGALDARYHFEYGTTTSYGSYSSEGDSGSGLGGVGASLPIGGLAGGTTYHYRIVAWNAEGTDYGADQTFTTPNAPTVTTGSATGIQQFQATLGGSVNPNGADTHYYFEYGTSTAYGAYSPALPGSDAGSTTAWEGNATISSLLAGTTYHYRLVASNWAGTTYGADHEFTTELTSTPVPVLYPNGNQYVYYRGTNGQLYFWLWNASKETWTLNWLESTHTMAGEPSAVLYPNGNQYVYYRGTNGQLYFWLWNASKETWTLNWLESTHAMAGDPTAVLYSTNGNQYVYYRGTNGQLFFWLWNASKETWTLNWLESTHAMAGDPTAVLYSTNGNQYVYYRGTNGQLFFWLWNASKETWTLNWEESTHTMAGDPTAVLYSTNGNQYVYYGGTNGQLFFWLWNASKETWTLNWEESTHVM